MFDKLLVANRGEIAIRIMRTARRLGIRTVAVYSDADAGAPHARLADEAVRIGPAPASDSYLRIDRIVAAARDSGASAVHPGYGFLSENAAFARALADAGIVFVGPPAAAIAAMGDKVESKRIARAAGVSVVPGGIDVVDSAAAATAVADAVGYPVMLKAAAGGGGKGMRIVREAGGIGEAFERSRSEARASFGDSRVFVEKFIEGPRHVEIQVLADRHGTALHLGERECSIQRRNQKVVEESPSPLLDAETRARMGAEAVMLAQAVGYESAGTVEFVVDRDRNFYFLEMNTRLQVEHPVTELVTGLDLVEQMLRVAAGEPLAMSQESVASRGWALEARVYAENPFRGFLPSTGKIVGFHPPVEAAGIRLDSGVCEGSEISVHYDPMIAKLCARADSRDAAIDRMADALARFGIEGVEHNLPFLAAVMDDPGFRSGDFDTGFIDARWPDGFKGAELADDDIERLAAVCAVARWREEGRGGAGYRPPTQWSAVVEDRSLTFELREAEEGVFLRRLDTDPPGEPTAVRVNWRPGAPLCEASVGGRALALQLQRQGEMFLLQFRGARVQVMLRSRRHAELARCMPAAPADDGAGALLCPMPGRVVSVDVEEGAEVEPGEALATVEAMKMENVLRADRKAKVKRIHAAPGDILAVDDMILEFF